MTHVLRIIWEADFYGDTHSLILSNFKSKPGQDGSNFEAQNFLPKALLYCPALVRIPYRHLLLFITLISVKNVFLKCDVNFRCPAQNKKVALKLRTHVGCYQLHNTYSSSLDNFEIKHFIGFHFWEKPML